MFAYSRFDKIVVGENVVLLGSNAFHNCEYLTDIVIGSKVAKIGNSALNAGLNLKNIYCKAQTPPNVESEALSVWEIRTLYVPVGCKQAYMSAQGWNKAKDIIEMEF